jgi:predicted transcriptional regulator of viral defense system
MENEQANNTFTSAMQAKDEGRAAYYKLLNSVRSGETVRIRRGVYAQVEQLADTMMDVDMVVPGGILCLFSAWNVHNLTTSLPQAYHIAVKRGRKIKLPEYPKIELHHQTDVLFGLGVEEKIVSGYNIRVYNAERSVCDAVKFRNKVGMDVCLEVVNTYLSRPERNISKLMDYAERLRVKQILEPMIAIKL